MADEAREVLEFRVDGIALTRDDLTFEELREHRKQVRDLSGDEDLNPFFAEPMDSYPVMHWLFKKRADPEYELEESLKLKMSDLLFSVKPEKTKRPTRAR